MHAIAIGLEQVVGRVDVRFERYHPQQSVLNPQLGQRQTACMRYISSPHRSHSIFSSDGAAVLIGVIGRAGLGGGSGIRSIMA
jgi:hypothetical protein